MLNFNFCAPTYFAFGKDREADTGDLITQFGGTKVLIHYGKDSAVKSGLLARIEQSLDQANIAHVSLGGVMPNPRDTLVYEGIDLCRQEKIDFVLAVGGGSVIDSAKAIAAGTVYQGDFWDFYCGKAAVEKALPIGTILTIAAAGSEGSMSSVITKTPQMLKRSTNSLKLRPKFSILNPALTQSLPPYQTAAGATDIFLHVLERYFSNTPDVTLTDRLCEALFLTILEEAPKVMANPDDYQARANIMWAGMLAHNDSVGVGREQDWSSHGIEHELSALYDVAHGAGLAVIAPAWMKFVAPKNPDKFVEFATRVMGCTLNQNDPMETVNEGIQKFVDFLKSLGMPTTMGQLGAKKEDIHFMAQNCRASDENTLGSFVVLSRADIEAIYHLAW